MREDGLQHGPPAAFREPESMVLWAPPSFSEHHPFPDANRSAGGGRHVSESQSANRSARAQRRKAPACARGRVFPGSDRGWREMSPFEEELSGWYGSNLIESQDQGGLVHAPAFSRFRDNFLWSCLDPRKALPGRFVAVHQLQFAPRPT